MKNYLIAVFTILILAACSKNEPEIDSPLSLAQPLMHDRIEIDIDENGTSDYRIQFDQPYFSGPYEGVLTGLVGRFITYGENEMLQNRDGRILFLRNLEEIQENVAEPLFWNNLTSVGEIVSITTSTTGEWPNEWDINSDNQHASYFLGLKIISDNNSQLAWIELGINTSDGKVSIVDKGIL